MSEHLVIAPEGDVERRRHAHPDCVRREREAGRLPLNEDVKSERSGGVLRGLRGFVRRSS
jgi:hypothetical protein